MMSRASPGAAIDSHCQPVTSLKVNIHAELLYEFLDHSRQFRAGHFAFQQHDPGSVVQIRKIEVKELP